MGAGGARDRLSNVVVNVWFLFFHGKQRDLELQKRKTKHVYIYSCTYFYIKKCLFVSSRALNLTFTLAYITFMLPQQLGVELHHLLVLFQLQHALAEVESQRKPHLFQRLPVLALLIHLRGIRSGQVRWDGGRMIVQEVVVIDSTRTAGKMKLCWGNDNRKI